ncbi:MAG: ABC transporter substrate-binding protein [Acidimicrobiaceae bacterium]|nr:ABC transporter substrate-binding protein [Acidimicrobiaceae bacterium]MYA00049.1 ABC transporter substrate-binding protein [Acidimicrobiaceae bacterium]MYE75117.1 ABC transporter substrate-binding protein [Acidimicrobiaceae bacterium]MYE96258.1 ABC transporter substrate-binding protein [Acidimicrobiaceae bacterium]MYI54243.1 ABC transporter substrate-binding protein [Acidimicrobiaceae bacterium]
MLDEADSSSLARRGFIKGGLGVAGFAAASAILAACGDDEEAPAPAAAPDGEAATTTTAAAAPTTTASDTVAVTAQGPEIEWEMATSWPTALVTLFGSAQYFARRVGELTGGRFVINARPAGEIVGGLEVLQTVRDLGVEMGHTASYYYVGISPVQQFGTAVPFGLNQRQQNAWLYGTFDNDGRRSGIDLLNEFYAEEHGIITFPGGATGCQMGGWFTNEINTVDDLNGLKMRIPGLAGRVLENLGGEQVTLAGGEILQAIQTGAIDGAEFVGPTDDLILGLNEFQGDLFYYHPGWWEPGTALEVQISLDRWNELPPAYQAAVQAAAADANMRTMATYDVLNQRDLQTVKGFAQIREFSPELMAAFKAETENVLDSVAAEDENFARILGPWREFRDGISEWHGLAERSFLSQQTQV